MKIKIIANNDNIRLSEELKLHFSKKMYKSIKSKNTLFYVNQKLTNTFEFIKKDDVIEFEYENVIKSELNWPIYESKLDIIYENDNYLIINKPYNLLSIPTTKKPRSVYQEVMYYLKDNNDKSIAILNRLDKDTEGLMLIAKNRLAASKMSNVHEKMERRYLALLEGSVDNDSGKIINYIAKEKDSIKRYITDEKNGKIAISNYKVIERFKDYTLTEFILETGRTHQIRLHAKSINHPIVGDKLYNANTNSDKMYLLSYYIKYYDEFKKEEIEIYLDKEYIKTWIKK